jgi:hypothetical protein
MGLSRLEGDSKKAKQPIAKPSYFQKCEWANEGMFGWNLCEWDDCPKVFKHSHTCSHKAPAQLVPPPARRAPGTQHRRRWSRQRRREEEHNILFCKFLYKFTQRKTSQPAASFLELPQKLFVA